MADSKKEDIETISTNSVLEILNLLSSTQKAEVLEHLKDGLSDFPQKKNSTDEIPVSIFSSEKISALEAISKYLKEETELEFKKIGEILNRNEVTIRTSYKRAMKKFPEKLDLSNYSLVIPINLFRNRDNSVLEIIVAHLHDNYKVSFKEIARLLCRNYKTVWTVYSKARKKRKDAGR